MDRPRAADDFAAIPAPMEELKRVSERVARDGEEKPLGARRWPTTEEVAKGISRPTVGSYAAAAVLLVVGARMLMV
jgi:hypothetical protein